MELNASGLNICLLDVNAVSALKSLASPDLAISMILESTRENLGQMEADLLKDSQQKTYSMVSSRLADMVLSQINVRVVGMTVDLNITTNRDVRLVINELMMPNRNRLELESLTMTESSHDLSQSIFLNQNTFGGTEVATIDRIVVNFDIDPLKCAAEIDHVRLDGLATLDILVLCLNEIVFKNAGQSTDSKQKGQEETRSEPVDLYCGINRIDILDSWDSTAMPLSLEDIVIEPTGVRIETVSMEDVLHVTPFVHVRFDKLLELFWEVPLSINIPMDCLGHLIQILKRAASLISLLNPPEDPEPAPMNIFLPELRLGIGTAITIHMFPHRVTELGVNIREIIITAGDGQVLISEIYFNFLDGLVVDKVNARLTQAFWDQISLLKTAINDQLEDKLPSDTESQEELKLPEMNMNFRAINIESLNDTRTKATINVQHDSGYLLVNAQISAAMPMLIASLELSAKLDALLKHIETDLHFKELTFELNPPQLSHQPGAKAGPEKEDQTPLPHAALFSQFVINVSLEKALAKIKGVNFLIYLGTTKLILNSLEDISIGCPKIAIEVEDPSARQNRISIFKAANIHVMRKIETVRVNIESVAFSSCADTYALLVQLPKDFATPGVKPPVKVDIDENLNIFDGVAESEFVPQNIILTKPKAERGNISLDIREDYYKQVQQHGRGRDSVLQLLGLVGNRLDSSLEIDIKRGQWQMYDGFDFHSSQVKMQQAVKRLSKAAQKLQKRGAQNDNNNNDDDDQYDDDAAVGDFMYQSMIITTVPAKAKDLKKLVAKDLGSTGDFVRSMDPKVIISLKRTRITKRCAVDTPNSHFSLVVKDGKVSDLVNTSKFKHLLWPETKSSASIVAYTQDVVGPVFAPEIRGSLHLNPLRLSLDQDTLEFLHRFFHYSSEEGGEISHEHSGISDFIQRFEFGGLQLRIDYNPQKVDYKSLRSGTAAEFLNIFAVKGAKLSLSASVIRGVDGWDALVSDLLELWMPDIRANQLTGLIAGVSPVRRALRVGKGVGKYTVVPIKRTQLTKGAGVVVRKTMDELLRLRTSWLDSADTALSG